MSESLSQQVQIEEQILVALRRITRANDLRSRTLLQYYGLTAPQLTTLAAIARMQPVTAGRLAVAVHLGQPTVTGILNRLQQRGLVQRVRGDRDRRNVNVSLTPEGQRLLENAPSLLQERFLAKLAELKDWEQTQILATLQRIADMMHAPAGEVTEPLADSLPEPTESESYPPMEQAPGLGDELPPAPPVPEIEP